MNEIYVKKMLFGAEITFILYDVEESIAKELVEEAYEEGIRLQRIFNLFDQKSSLSLLNKNRKMKMPSEFIEVLERSLKMCRRTNGLYDISLGKQFLDRKSGKEISKVDYSYKDIEITGNTVELKNNGIVIDLGSIAKGYITDKMADILIAGGIISGMIDSRGDIIVFGDIEREIKIQHPREKVKFIGSVNLKEGGIATSGDYNQYDKTFDKSHILNKKEYISVTVIASTLTEADLYATALMVLSKKDGINLLKENNNIKCFCVDKDLKISKYNSF